MKRKTTITLFALLVLAAFTLTVAFADRANFDERRTGAKCAGANLDVSFRKRGWEIHHSSTTWRRTTRRPLTPALTGAAPPAGGKQTRRESQVTITDTDHNVSYTLPGSFRARNRGGSLGVTRNEYWRPFLRSIEGRRGAVGLY